MNQKRPRINAQLVGELLAEALRRARPVSPESPPPDTDADRDGPA